jgi:hypothetical protein
LLLGGAMALMKPYMNMAQANSTREKLNKISDALAMFAQTYGQLPCPASSNPGGTEPFGSPIGSGVNGTYLTDQCDAEVIPGDYIGIVPFRALGLTEDNVRDGYGNLITYAATPVMAGLRSGTGTYQHVHETCRGSRWIDTTGPTNLNPIKALLCCPRYTGVNHDLQVMDALTGGNTVYTGLHSSAAVYDARTVIDTTPLAAEVQNTHVIAFVLTSHGKNGDGAYIANSALVNPVTANAGAQESENRDGDMVFVDRPITLSDDNNYFDDIVVWRTNDQLVSAFSNDSCGRP